MALNIKDPEADRLARELASVTGESITQAVSIALEERLSRVRGTRAPRSIEDVVAEIAQRCARLPILDDRPADEILGYDDAGLAR